MVHYPLYTHNLSLVGVCVKRIGKQACSSGGGGGGGGDPIRQFTSWDDINPGETVVINGEVKFADYTANLQTGVATIGTTQITAAEVKLTYENNGNLERVDIDAGGASVDFDENQGDDIDLVLRFGNLVGGAVSANGEEVGLWAEPVGLGFNYQTFGVWFTGLGTGAGIAAVGSFGAKTANVPTVGTVTYNGGAAGFALDAAGIPYLVVSDSEVVVNFPNETFTFATTGSAIDNLNDANELDFVPESGLNLSGGGSLSGNSLQGNVSAVFDMSGTLDGSVYGVNGSEVGGLFELSGPAGLYVGSFGAVD